MGDLAVWIDRKGLIFVILWKKRWKDLDRAKAKNISPVMGLCDLEGCGGNSGENRERRGLGSRRKAESLSPQVSPMLIL